MDYDFSKTKKFISSHNFLFNVLKVLVFLISFYYLILILSENYKHVSEISQHYKYRTLLFVLFSSIVYIMFLVFLALGWITIIEKISNKSICKSFVYIYLKSLIYKYLPGNVFHYANRQLAAQSKGINHAILLKSNIYEAVYLISSALFLSIFYYKLWLINHSYIGFYSLIILISLFILIIVYVFMNKTLISMTIQSIPYYLLYFSGIGLLCYLAINIFTENNLSFLQCVSLYSIAWIAGFIIPGAPGGIGVRESVFILLSNNLINQSDAIFIIALLRISTTFGELFAYIIAQFNYRFDQNDTSSL